MNSVKLARYRAGVSVKAAAEKTGIPAATIYRWERGTTPPPAEAAKALAVFYGTTVDILLGVAGPDQEAAA